jgi:hypothetical protein
MTRAFGCAGERRRAETNRKTSVDEVAAWPWDADCKAMNRTPLKYTKLSDAADKTGDERYRGGAVGIWYARASVHRDLYEGYARAKARGYDITRKTLEKTHVYLGSIEADEPYTAYALMDAHRWSPNGEANDWLTAFELNHTSMVVGDVLDFHGKLLFLEFEGFTELGDG